MDPIDGVSTDVQEESSPLAAADETESVSAETVQPETETTETVQAEGQEGQESEVKTQVEPPDIVRQRTQIKTLETDLSRVGGKDGIQALAPFYDLLRNVEAGGPQFKEYLDATVGPEISRDIAFAVAPEIEGDLIKQRFGDDATPELIDRLLGLHRTDPEAFEPADYRTDAQKAQDEAKDREMQQLRKENEETKKFQTEQKEAAKTQRLQQAYTGMLTSCQERGNKIAQNLGFGDSPDDAPEIKTAKGDLREAVEALTSLALSSDSDFQSVLGFHRDANPRAKMLEGLVFNKLEGLAQQRFQKFVPILKAYAESLSKPAREREGIREDISSASNSGLTSRKEAPINVRDTDAVRDYMSTGWSDAQRAAGA